MRKSRCRKCRCWRKSWMTGWSSRCCYWRTSSGRRWCKPIARCTPKASLNRCRYCNPPRTRWPFLQIRKSRCRRFRCWRCRSRPNSWMEFQYCCKYGRHRQQSKDWTPGRYNTGWYLDTRNRPRWCKLTGWCKAKPGWRRCPCLSQARYSIRAPHTRCTRRQCNPTASNCWRNRRRCCNQLDRGPRFHCFDRYGRRKRQRR